MKSAPSPLLHRVALALVTAGGINWALPGHAATINKANNTTALNQTGSWTGAVVPTAADIAQWTSTVTGANTTGLGGNLSWLGIKVTNPGGLVTVNSGSTLTLGASGIDMTTATQSLTFSPAMVLGAAQSWTVNTGRTLTKNGTTDLGGFTLTLDGAGTKALTGVVSNGTIIVSAGTATLSGANTFSGGVTLNAGTLNLNASGTGGTSSALGTGLLTINGGSLGNSSAAAVSLSTNNAQVWNANFGFTGNANLNLGTGAVSMNGSRQITTTGSGFLTVGGTISETVVGSSLTKAGNGTLILNGSNAYTGGTIVNGGTLSATVNGNFGANVLGNNIVANPGGNVAISSTSNVGSNQTITVNSDAAGLGGVGTVLDAVPAFANVRAGGATTGGVFGINTVSQGFGTPLDMSTLGGGGMFLGSQFGGTYAAPFLLPDGGVYRLGGGTGALTVAGAVLTGAGNSVVVGDTRVNGTGTVILTAANDYAGTTTIAAGALQLGSGGTSGSIDATANVVNNGTLIFNRSDAVTFDRAISGSGGIVHTGPNQLTLGAANSYAGSTVINAGSLVMGIAGAIPTGTAMTLGTGTTPVGLNLNGFDATVGSLSFLTNASAANTVTISAGNTLTVSGTGGFILGTPTNSTTTNATFTGGGALAVDNAGANILVGQSAPDQNSTTNTETLDVSALASFATNVNEFRIGLGTRVNATVKLSNTSNTITANTITVSDTGANNGGPALVTLGSGANVIQANTITLGQGKGAATVAFASTTPGSPGIVTITNKTGGGANLTLGHKNTDTAATVTGTLDLRGHSASITAGTVILGQDSSTGTSTSSTVGTIYFEDGTFSVTSLQLGNKTNSAASRSAVGVLNISGGSFIVNSGGLFRLSNRSGSGGTASGTVNLTGGILTSNVGITDGGQTGATSVLTVDGGTLNMLGNAIGTAAAPIDTLNLQSGTLQNIGEINGGGAVTKTAGTVGNTLTIADTNSFTGLLNVEAGVVSLEGTLSGTAAINVNTGALAGVGSTSRPTVIGNSTGTADAFLGAGVSGIGTLGTGALALNSDATFQLQFNIAGSSSFTSDLVNVTGDLALAGNPALLVSNLGSDLALVPGTVITFLDYSGAWNNGTFGGLLDDSTFAVGANQFRISYDGVDNNSSEVVLQSVPEPGSAMIVLAGIGGLAAFRRRRTK